MDSPSGESLALAALTRLTRGVLQIAAGFLFKRQNLGRFRIGDTLALGFFGVLTLGMHHQMHHLMLARGMNPHQWALIDMAAFADHREGRLFVCP